jgi:thioredoxin 1
MATVEITKENFEEVVQNNPFVVLDFWAEWCVPCKRFAPIFEEASERHDDIVFGKVDTEEQPELQAAFDIRSIPTIMVIRDATIIHQQPGMLPANLLETLIEKAREVDMAEVKEHAASHQH